MTASGTSALDGGFHLVERGDDLGPAECLVEVQLGADEELVGPELLRAELQHPHDSGIALERLPDGVDMGGRRCLADEEALHLDGEVERDHDEERADGEAAGGVVAAVAGGRGGHDSGERETQPDERTGVFEQHDGELGALRLPDERAP